MAKRKRTIGLFMDEEEAAALYHLINNNPNISFSDYCKEKGIDQWQIWEICSENLWAKFAGKVDRKKAVERFKIQEVQDTAKASEAKTE